MTNKHIFLPLYIKLLIVISDWFFLFGLLISFPVMMFIQLGFEIGRNSEETIIWTLSQASILFLIGLIRALRRIIIIESATTFTSGIAVGEIILLDSSKKKYHKTLFRLSVEFKNENNNSSIVKNYYLVNSKIARNKYDYTFVYNINTPEKVVLINLLPKLVKNYLKKIESTIANKPQ
ncbi:hypothetical protein [Carboxylicivirga marina]|uniref:DUF304 domain-containing protein n=1 Tax=Carboxylicivirga marina TaxID=2800988 RepID=A0ABS1HQT5_9BACT|nr:hypothetical protein [Carboxylicivirga marina]MBK3519980.1 hypothetical protein [Carboxylicivirga marina]